MKALQNNSEWISQVYEQGSGEGNWKVADVSFKQSRIPQSIVSATTSSATILSPDGGYSSTQDITVGNSTDGEVAITAPITNNPYSAFSGTWNPQLSTTNYWDSANSGISNNNQLISALMTPDGTILYRKYSSGDTWYKFTLATPFRPLTNGNTFETSFSLTSQVGLTLPQSQKASYAAGGNYVLIFGYRQSVALIKLGTPYLLETAVSTQVVDLESKYRSRVATWNSNYEYQMFSGMKLSSDGTKGILSVKGAGSTTGNAALSGCSFADFTLTTPFDLSTFTFGNTSAFNENSGQTGHFIHYTEITEDGKYIHFLNSNYQYGYGYFRTIALADAWDVSGSYSRTMSEYSSNFVQQSTVYSATQTGSLIFDDAGKNITGFGIGGKQTLVSAWSGKFLPTTELNISGASLTTAPTSIVEDFTVSPTVSIQAQTKEAFNKEDTPFGSDGYSTLTSLRLYNPTYFSGSQLLQTGDTLILDGSSVTTGTVTYTDTHTSAGSFTNSPTPNTKKNQFVSPLTRFYLAQSVNLNNQNRTEHRNTAHNQMGFTFSHDGKKLFTGSRDTSYTFAGVTITNKNWIEEYSMSTPWDFSTLTPVTAIQVSNSSLFPKTTTMNYFMDFRFNDDGTKFYQVTGYSSTAYSYLQQYSLSSPYNLAEGGTLEATIPLSLTTGYGGAAARYYSVNFSQDGLAMVLGYSTDSSWSVSGAGNCFHTVVKLSSPFDISTAQTPIQMTSSNDTAMYQPDITGSSDIGYYIYSWNDSAQNAHQYLFIRGRSGDITSDQENYVNFQLTTSIPSGWTNIADYYYGGKFFDGGTKLIMYFPGAHKLDMFVGDFGPTVGQYTVDVTSANLSALPDNIRLGSNTTYDSLGTPTISSSTSSERTYAYPSKSLDAEALRFKIEGDTDAEIKQVNVDLFTS